MVVPLDSVVRVIYINVTRVETVTPPRNRPVLVAICMTRTERPTLYGLSGTDLLYLRFDLMFLALWSEVLFNHMNLALSLITIRVVLVFVRYHAFVCLLSVF